MSGSICPYTIKDLSDLEIVQWDLFSACDWSGDGLLRFNVLKCKYTQHGNVKFEHKYQMRDAKELLLLCPKTHKTKDLLMIFQDSLKFDKQLYESVGKANRILGLIKRSFSYWLLKLYKTLTTTTSTPHCRIWKCDLVPIY